MSEIESILEELSSEDEQRCEQAIIRLVNMGESALTALKPQLTHPQADQRWWAVRALAGFLDREATRLLIEAMDDAEPSVRHCAALALAGRSDEDAIAALVAALFSPDRLFARLAANSLVSTGTAAVPALLNQIEQNAEAPRVEIYRSLALIGDPRAIPALFNATEDDSALTEYWAQEGLERMGVGMVYFKPE